MHYKNLYRIMLLPAIAVLLASCEASSRVGAPVPESVIPEGLKDCEFFALVTAHGSTIHVVRCPNSSTSAARTGKNPVYTTTIDTAAPAASDVGYVSAEDQRRAAYEAHMAVIDANIKRLELQAAELRAKQGN